VARYQPALLGGLFIGILSALPIIGAFNACCCLWVVVGGLLTTYLMQQNDPMPIETSTAAAQREAMDQVFSQMGDVPPEMVEMIERFSTGPAALLITAAVTIPVFAVFGLLGALLGLAFFRKKAGPAVG